MTDGAARKPVSPPLFIKVEKYRDVIQNLEKLRSYSLSLRDALDALSDLEKELQTGLAVCHRALDNFNNIISMLDAKLSRAQIKERELETVETEMRVETPREIEEFVSGLHKQMERIKQDLRTVSR